MLKNKKRGVELTLNTIVIAALALTVLVILIVVLIKYSGGFTSGASSCAAKINGARCLSNSCSEGTYFIGTCDSKSTEGQAGGCKKGMACFCCAPESSKEAQTTPKTSPAKK